MTRATSFRVKHIEGGFVTVQMTQSEKARCADRCAGMGDPPCWQLPSKTSDWPKWQRLYVCLECADQNNEGKA